MGLVLAPFGGRGCGTVRGSAVPEVGAASGKQKEIKARRARMQLRIGVCVRVGCARVSGRMCACTACTDAALMPTFASLELCVCIPSDPFPNLAAYSSKRFSNARGPQNASGLCMQSKREG